MSDFLTGLRAEVLDAHAAQRRRRRGRRAARLLTSRAPGALAVATAVGALLVAVLAVRQVVHPPPAGPRVIDVIRIGGNPTDAVSAGGSVWVSDFARRQVIRLSPADRRPAGRIAVGGRPVAVAGGDGGVWVRTAAGDGGAVARLGSASATPVGFGATLAVGPSAVWAADVELGPERLHRIDGGTGRDSDLVDIHGVYALASGGTALWAVTGNGTVLHLDGRTGAVRARWPALAISAGSAAPAITADSQGAWVLRVGQGPETQAIRLEDDHVVRRLSIPPSVRPLLAEARDGLWTVSEDAVRHRSTALRLDARTGSVTARVELGTRNPTALLPVGDELWITASDGTVTAVDD